MPVEPIGAIVLHPSVSGSTPHPERPVVSVIMPTYNRLQLLRDAVESVLAQTYSAWELIVADDGSTDGTRPYLEALERGDQRNSSLRSGKAS